MSQSIQYLSSLVQSCRQWRLALLRTSRHDFLSSLIPQGALARTRTMALFFQMFHPHPLLQHHHSLTSHTSQRLHLLHNHNTSRQTRVHGTPYLRKSTGWPIASSNFNITLRCRSSKSARLLQQWILLLYSYVFIYLYFIQKSRWYEGDGGVRCSGFWPYRFQRLPIDQTAFPKESTEKDKSLSVSTNGFGPLPRKFSCNVLFHSLCCTERRRAFAEKAV